jgi:hypothetical protein
VLQISVGEVILGAEVDNLTGDLGGEVLRVEGRDPAHARTSLARRAPEGFAPDAVGGYRPQTGDDDASPLQGPAPVSGHGHGSSLPTGTGTVHGDGGPVSRADHFFSK